MKYLPLNKICNIVMGQAPPGSSYNSIGDGYPLVAGAGDFGENSPLISKFTTSPTRLSNPGDILLCIRATIGDTNWSDRQYCLGRGVAGLCPNPKLSDRFFVWHWLRSVNNLLKKNAKGSTFKQISRGDIETLPFPDMGLTEQKRIAAILDKADAIRRKRQQAIQLVDEFLRSVFLDMFGDPVKNPKGWEVRSVGELLSFLTSGSRGWARYYAKKGRVFLRIQNIGKNELLLDDVAYVKPPDSAEAKRTLVQPGDVILSITADLGRTAVIPEGMAKTHINQHLAILRFDHIDPLYASAYLSSPGGQRQIDRLNREGVKAGLNFDDIRSLQILLPPGELQKKWVKIYKKTAFLKTCFEGGLTMNSGLFQSLAQRAFRGEL